MELTWILISATLFFGTVLGSLFLLFRKSSGQAAETQRTLQDCFDRMQNQWLAQQRETERTLELKSTALRTELSTQLQSNRQELQLGLQQTSQALEGRFTAIDGRLDARLKDLTEGVQTKLEANLKEGFNHFAKVEASLRNAELQLQDLNRVGKGINELNNLLKLPHLRGGFGEATLERLLSDFLPQNAYELQYRVVPDSTERVDAVIKYPQYVLPIDSKFPREQVLPLFETDDPVQLEKARRGLVDVMRVIGKSIRSKYIHPEHGTTDMALLFVPSETLYFEVLKNTALCEELNRSKVFIVSPNTFSAMLHAVAMARTYYEMAQGVEKTLLDLQKATTHLSHFQERFQDVGKALEKAQNTFDTATTHLTRYSNSIQRIVGTETDAVGSGPKKLETRAELSVDQPAAF
jgi:DNA recombination protein RmuC